MQNNEYNRKYAEQGRYKQFKASLLASEYESLKGILNANKISNVDFIRLSYRLLLQYIAEQKAK